MKKGGLVHGAWQDLRGAPRRSLVSMLGIAMGVAILLVIVGLGLGARSAVLKKIVQELPVDHIEVVPATIDLGIFQVDTSALFGGSGFGPGAVQQLQEIEGVAAVYPKLEVKLPLGARGGGRFFGRPLYTDLFMTGVPPALLKAEVPSGFEDSGEEIPVVISEQLIEIYNGSVAPAIGTPKITHETLRGVEFDIVVGRSLMLGERGVKKKGLERARIVGVSRFGIKLGATVPISVARRLMTSYGTARPETYSSLIVKAAEPAQVPAIIEAIEAQGFRVDKRAERTRDILMTLILFGSSLGLLVLTLAGLNITHSFFAQLSERKREFAVMRAVGAKKRHIVGLVLWQATLLGLLGGLVGAVAARGITWGLDALALRWLPEFPFRPESFFELPLWGDGLALVAAVAAAVLGALWPALRAGRASIVRLFADL